MKKIKYILLIVVFMLIGLVNVKAEVKNCEYDFYIDEVKKTIIVAPRASGAGAGGTIIVTYDSSTQKVTGKVKEFDSKSVTNTYKTYDINQVKVEEFSKEDFVDSNGKLSCPASIAVKEDCISGYMGDIPHDYCALNVTRDKGNDNPEGYKSTGGNDSVLTKYILFSGAANNDNVNIYNTNGTVIATLMGKNISISNMSTYSSAFTDKKTSGYPKYLVKKGDSYSFESTKPEEFDQIYMNIQYLNSIQGLGEEEIYNTCKDIFGESFLKWLDENVFMIIRIGVPILLILLTTFDFAKVVFNDDKEGMQNAFTRFRRRAIAAVLIFLTPTIIMLIANLVGGEDLNSVTDCVNYIENMHE